MRSNELLFLIFVINFISVNAAGTSTNIRNDSRFMKSVGKYESGMVSFLTNTTDALPLSSTKIRKPVIYKDKHTEAMEVILTIIKIESIQGSHNSYSSSIANKRMTGFDIIFDSIYPNSIFNVTFQYLAFENHNYLQVYYFFETQTSTLSSYDVSTASKQQIQSQKIATIDLTNTKSHQIVATSFLLGVKMGQKNNKEEDSSVSLQTYVDKLKSVVEVNANTWNQVHIQAVSFVVVVWSEIKYFQGVWKEYQYDYQKNTYKNHPWVNPSIQNRFALLSLPISQNGAQFNDYIALYGIRGFDIRNGPISVIVDEVTYNLPKQSAEASIGIKGQALLVGVEVSTILISDILGTSSSSEESSTMMLIIIGSGVIFVLMVICIVYLKFFTAEDKFKHQVLDSPKQLEVESPSPKRIRINLIKVPISDTNFTSIINQINANNGNSSGSNSGSNSDSPEGKSPLLNLRKQVKGLLVSKDLLTGVKASERFNHIEVQSTIIVEQTNEGSPKNAQTAPPPKEEKEQKPEKLEEINKEEGKDNLERVFTFQNCSMLSSAKSYNKFMQAETDTDEETLRPYSSRFQTQSVSATTISDFLPTINQKNEQINEQINE